MENNKKWIIVLLVFALVMVGAYALYTQLGSQYAQEPLETESQKTTDHTTEEEPVKLAPDFVVYDINGKEVKLSDFFGKPIVLNFWASWCGPCKMEMPDFNEKYQEIGDQVQFLMINVTDGSRETVEIASAFIAQQGFAFPVFFDITQNAAYVYSTYSLPTTYFIDAKGQVIARAVGAISAETLQKGINMIT